MPPLHFNGLVFVDPLVGWVHDCTWRRMWIVDYRDGIPRQQWPRTWWWRYTCTHRSNGTYRTPWWHGGCCCKHILQEITMEGYGPRPVSSWTSNVSKASLHRT